MYWALGGINILAGTLVTVTASLLPFGPPALVCHVLGIWLATREILEFFDGLLPGVASMGSAVAGSALVAILGITYLPIVWPAWSLVSLGIGAIAFLVAYGGAR